MGRLQGEAPGGDSRGRLAGEGAAVTGNATSGRPTGQAEGRRSWRRTYDGLASRERSSLSPAELDLLAEALFWLDQPEASVEVRRSAYTAHVTAGDAPAAAMAAWQLYYDHALVGEESVANGWLERARQSVPPGVASTVAGFVTIAEADRAHHRGDLDAALAAAAEAVRIARSSGDPDLTAMALQTRGRLLIAAGRVADGVALLDDAMLCVVSGELRPLFTGWVYCAVLGACHDIADLRRAAEWTDAAMRWCDDLDDGLLYPGLCRIHRVELACLRGAWTTADREAERACSELGTHDRRYAGEAVYLAADLARLRGDLDRAEEGFRHAHALGREPQPGLALVWLALGRPAAAAAALRLALEPGPAAPLTRARLLSAVVEAELALGELHRAAAAAEQLTAIAEQGAGPYLDAIAAGCQGSVRIAHGDVPAGHAQLRRAKLLFQELVLPYETARVQVELAAASRLAGDVATAELELRAAETAFRRLGAARDLAEVQRHLRPVEDARPPISDREIEVLRLVAEGRTNRRIAATLMISEHTVARHVSNIFLKLDVHSRAAATAWAYEHDLLS